MVYDSILFFCFSMAKTIITSWPTYVDIDALTCILVYADFLQKRGEDVFINYSKNFSPTITNDIKVLAEKLLPRFQHKEIQADDMLILVDVSDIDYLKPFIDFDQVVQVIDHHFWYEQFWQNRLWPMARIEHVWSCSTLLYEEIVAAGFLEKLEKESGELLYKCAVGHTLHMQSQVTTQRDRDSITQLQKIVDVPVDRVEHYFKEIDAIAAGNIERYIAHETKIVSIHWIEVAISQLEMRDSHVFLCANCARLDHFAKNIGTHDWLFTCPSISEGKNYLYTKSQFVKELCVHYFETHFSWDIWETKLLWMRKEMLREILTLT